MNDTQAMLEAKFKEIGIRQGDILYVASDITRYMYNLYAMYENKVKEYYVRETNFIIDALEAVLGTKGTLLFPVFTWDFCHGKGFNYRKTKGACGSLANRALVRKDFQRTQHPLYSFMVHGHYTSELLALKNTDSWSEDSPFGWLHRHDAKQLHFDVNLTDGLTFMHYMEQQLQVKYRFRKSFTGNYVDADGKVTQRLYTMYVRNYDLHVENHMPADFLDRISNITYIDDAVRLQVFSIREACKLIQEDFINNQGQNIMRYVD